MMTIRTFFKTLIESGSDYVALPSEKRNIRLTNFTALFISSVSLIPLGYRLATGNANLEIAVIVMIESLVTISPVILNRTQHTNASRILISWFPSVVTIFNAMIIISKSVELESSTFVGFRFFLIAVACIPFLVFNLSERGYMTLALVIPLFCLFLFDPILSFFGFGYQQVGLHEPNYSYNTLRSVISYSILGASFLFLKYVVEKSEEVNSRLLNELDKKNKMILQQAAKEVSELDNKLYDNLLQLKEREFILNESQRIAKIGSWRYQIGDDLAFWSDEMYNIFGVDKSFQPTAENVRQLFEVEPRDDIRDAYARLLANGDALDISPAIKTPFDQKKWIRISGFPLYNGDRISGVIGICHDITTYKEGEERSQELAEANKKIGELRLMALRSVMNPHFIFNVLNSIQFFIASNDRLNAINYLSKFSKLMRSILTNSVNNNIRLVEEIEILKNYVHLEMVRFENKFSFSFEIDPNLEIDGIEIPSLLIQPYVENAILHGLYNKVEKGALIIRIREDKDAVVFEIEDDGVGREAALKIKERSFSEHKSLGVKLTEERLKLINQQHNVSYQIIDLMKGDQPCGTKVIVWIKVY